MHTHSSPLLVRRRRRSVSRSRATRIASVVSAAVALFAPATAMPKDWAQIASAMRDDALVVRLGHAEPITLARSASEVIVSDARVVDVTLRTATQPVLHGERIGHANILFYDAANDEIDALKIRVEHDLSALQATVQSQFPEARVRAQSILGEIVLSGSTLSSAESAAIQRLAERFLVAVRASRDDGVVGGVDPEASGVTNRITILNDEQVLLQVRVAEVNRSVLKRLGVDWEAGLQASVVDNVFRPGAGFQDASLTFNGGLSSFLKVLERHSLVRTLAEPSLTAVSGESASFLAGGEYPIPVSAGNNGVSVEFKKYGVALDFTPVVIGDGRISLQIRTEVSDIADTGAVTAGGVTVPGVTVRRARTSLEMSSGGTIMMAGLIQQSTRRRSSGLPGLRSLPIIGAAFRSEESQVSETELVVLVTPMLVQDAAAQDFAAPTDGFAPASDLDMYLYGRLHAIYGSGEPDASEAKAAALSAPFGFIME